MREAQNPSSHLSDRELLMALDGELTPRDSSRVEAHLTGCWTCRSRKLELERAIADFVHLQQENLSRQLPPREGPRALLKAHLAQMARTQSLSWWQAPVARRAAWIAAAACGLTLVWAAATRWIPASRPAPALALAVPNPNLTPGAAVLLSRNDVCRAPQPKNKEVPVALRRRVFEEYGLAHAETRAYEVDYLITPALGGAEDIHNLWPQPYKNTEWNAKVKDALEDRLHTLVCEGKLDLGTAQREIASNWIDAYKRYLHTDQPTVSDR
jgi:hypothetical protein